jgi:uncharacterized cofD-like protein
MNRAKGTRIRRAHLRQVVGPALALYRWAAMAAVGVLLAIFGFLISLRQWLAPVEDFFRGLYLGGIERTLGADSAPMVDHFMGLALFVGGIALALQGGRTFVRKVVQVVSPNVKSGVGAAYVRRRQLAMGPRIVAIGGGTGLSTLLRGLKQHTSNVTAIVTVTDDGGSSGRLRSELGIVPPGDMRNCLVALADEEKLMTDLFQHRFTRGSGGLSGHSIGNLLLAGFIEQAAGDLDEALKLASQVLNIRGRVLPSSMDNIQLRALMEGEDVLVGETAIVESGRRIRRLFLDPENARAHPEALEAIRNAELICIGPGSVYTSVIPNLLVPGIIGALEDADCPKVYICNVMTQMGESQGFTAAEHLLAIQANVEGRFCDHVLVNTGRPSADLLERYMSEGQEMVEPDMDRIKLMGLRPIPGNYMSESDTVRHDPLRLAARLMELA